MHTRHSQFPSAQLDQRYHRAKAIRKESRHLDHPCSMAAVWLFSFIIVIINCAWLALAISSYCMPPSSAANSFHGLCRDINDVDPLAKCAPGLELLGFGVDMTMCKSYGCRPHVDFDPLFDRKEVNT
jgi:hypothetical protein